MDAEFFEDKLIHFAFNEYFPTYAIDNVLAYFLNAHPSSKEGDPLSEPLEELADKYSKLFKSIDPNIYGLNKEYIEYMRENLLNNINQNQ